VLGRFLPPRRRAAEAELHVREARADELRREAMRAMHEALDATERARRVHEEFLARMSHELRTPLNAVIGFSRVLEKNQAGNQRPQDLELLSRVRDSGERLLRLIEGVLDQAGLRDGRLPIALVDTDVAEVSRRVIGEFESRARAKGIHIYGLIPSEPCTACLDATRFEQIVYHLVDNAVKFTPAGDVWISMITDAGTRRPVRLVVSDTGIGIPPHQLERIFSPFEQGDASRSRAFDGAGLGLPLARQLCEAMGCTLSVESHVGLGSRFIIRFP
jgi:signal transduction histidine kinase